jgi:hypothetical protein
MDDTHDEAGWTQVLDVRLIYTTLYSYSITILRLSWITWYCAAGPPTIGKMCWIVVRIVQVSRFRKERCMRVLQTRDPRYCVGCQMSYWVSDTTEETAAWSVSRTQLGKDYLPQQGSITQALFFRAQGFDARYYTGER